MEMTYEQLVCHLREKASTNVNAVGIFLEDFTSKRVTTIINNKSKKYNQAYIVIGPVRAYDIDKRSNSDISYYYCNNIQEAKEIGEYLISNSSSWIIETDPEDMLEQIYDRY